MALEAQQRAPDGYPEENLPADFASVSPWRPVGVVVLGLGLVLSGTNVLRWRAVEPPRVEAPTDETLPLTLEPGSRHELEVPGVMRVAVGSPGVVDAHVVDERRLKVEPLGPGTTTLLVWMQDGTRRTYTVSVRAR
jgi:Flp pilus assembly secretin CpaC